MKKSLFSMICSMVALLVFTSYASAGTAAVTSTTKTTPYTVVVPLKYDPIQLVNRDFFITCPDNTSANPMYNLYNFNGDLLLSGVQDISFAGKWIIVKKGEKYGVLTRTIQEVIPFQYSRIIVTDATHCVGIDGKEFVRPGEWYGNRYHYDLTTGKIVEELGYGGESQLAGSSSYSVNQYRADSEGSAGISIIKKSGIINKYGLEAGASYTAYNDGGQLLLDFTPYCRNGFNTLSYGCTGHLFYGYVDDGNNSAGALNYVFSGRGRLIAVQRGASFQGLYGGNYICAYGNSVYGTKPYLLNWDGKTVIPAGVFDSYSFNYTDSDAWTAVSDDPSPVIVSKDGKYGIITLADYVSEPSVWAQNDVTQALNKNLIPDEAQVWWKDSCTRYEFCKMLALTVKEITSLPLTDLATGKEAVSFTDSNDADIIAASALGLVKGVGNNRFAPNNFITREQAAVMLARTASLLKLKGTGQGTLFADRYQFANWSAAEIAAVSAILCGSDNTPLMQGTGNNYFSPRSSYTVEQAAITMLRLTKAK